MAAPSNPGPSPVVMDLGLRSDPNLHRAYRGPFRVRIKARQRSGWRRRDFWKADREIDIHVGDRNLERKVVEKNRAHTPLAASLPSASCQLKMPAAARKSELPLSRFPQGKAWAGKVPPTPRMLRA